MCFKRAVTKLDYNYKLLKATVEEVYNDLIIDAKLNDGQVFPAFCGALEAAEMCAKGTTVWLKRTSKNKRLIKYNVSFVQTPEGIVFANPKYNKQLFQEAFEKGALTDFADYDECRQLPDKDNASGLDFELTGKNGKKCYVFVTSVYNKQNGCAVFPHAINFFEMKMIEAMEQKRRLGAETCIFMIVPREDCVSAKFVWNLDPHAAASMFDAAKSGLNFLCYGCKISKDNIEIDRKMEILY